MHPDPQTSRAMSNALFAAWGRFQPTSSTRARLVCLSPLLRFRSSVITVHIHAHQVEPAPDVPLAFCRRGRGPEIDFQRPRAGPHGPKQQLERESYLWTRNSYQHQPQPVRQPRLCDPSTASSSLLQVRNVLCNVVGAQFAQQRNGDAAG